jgi:hypothetical protein
MTDDVLDDLFHGCALAAYLQQASAQRGWPDCEATRCRAFALYEQALRTKHDAPDAGASFRRLRLAQFRAKAVGIA